MKPKLLLPLALIAALASPALGVQTILYDIDTILIGSTSPAPPPPYAFVSIETVDSDSVLLTVQSSLAGPAEFWSAIGFNLRDNYVFNGGATVGSVNTSGTFDAPTVSFGTNIQSGGGGIDYDLWFDFKTGPPSVRFDGVDSFSIQINGVTTDDFVSTPVNHQVIFHAQGLAGGDSSWIASGAGATQLPEPSSALLGGLGFLALLRRNRSRK